jgi:hypothetical protein
VEQDEIKVAGKLAITLTSSHPGAHDLLTWLELAYPHYVELFGREPVGIDEKRMVVVYARSERDLKKVLAADGYSTGVAGGVTYTGTSYQYPSTLYYHQRYIVIHECTHLFQRCVSAGGTWSSPLWFFEGIADSMASHVYDEAKKRLTVHVLDKGTKGNYLAAGHSYLEKKPKTTASSCGWTGREPTPTSSRAAIPRAKTAFRFASRRDGTRCSSKLRREAGDGASALTSRTPAAARLRE